MALFLFDAVAEQSAGLLASIRYPNKNVPEVLEPVTETMSRRLLREYYLISGSQHLSRASFLGEWIFSMWKKQW